MSKIKICGITTNQELEYIEKTNQKPDFIGFVFAKSKRQVNDMRQFNLPKDIKKVGVFVNPTLEEIEKNYEFLDVIQLHGDETEEFIKKIKGKTVIKAISVNSIEDIRKWNNTKADFLLLDNGKGGTGKQFDWNILKEKIEKPYFLAGGINKDNIKTALEFNPYCIDVSSGVEVNGKKDNKKMIDIINIVRSDINGKR